ncbi:MAG: hypothetical protein HN985_04850 [Planctomycetaceae bacterium]|nr:hypothetical protein [Planctomycetaceae bacterium]MBT6642288.1 hypothetical protein [Planctomycetaceae bacterium]MBT6919032.1 hypothetical protein [Planctomycetaceae bacterium]
MPLAVSLVGWENYGFVRQVGEWSRFAGGRQRVLTGSGWRAMCMRAATCRNSGC